jgi:sigma-B regulation protein RsbU (phosphoserine phosphatase)
MQTKIEGGPAVPGDAGVPGLDVAGFFLPASGVVGGDFYDVFKLSGPEWGITIGDACGNGAPAAALSTVAQTALHAASTARRGPAEALAVMNEAVMRADVDEGRCALCTTVVGRLSGHGRDFRLRMASAGHPPVIIVRAGGTVNRYGPTGPMLGVFDAPFYGERAVDLEPGDVCVLYTDGVTDARRHGQPFGEDRLGNLIQSGSRSGAAWLATRIRRAVVGYQSGVIRDDIAVLVIAVPPPPSGDSPRRTPG